MTSMAGYFTRSERYYLRYKRNGRLVRKAMGAHIKTDAQAQRVVHEFEKKRADERLALLDPSTAKLDAFRKEYVAHRTGFTLSKETIRKDDLSLRSLASVLGESCMLRTINQLRVDEWAKHLMGSGVKPATVNGYLRHIRAALNVAVEWGRLEKAPRLKGVKEPKRLPRAFTPQQAARILFLEKNWERRALWRFILWTGIRRQEVVDLEWRQVHLGDSPWIMPIGKGDKERIIPLVPQAVKALETMPKMDMGKVWRFHFRKYKEAKPVTGSPISRWFKAAARRAGIKEARFHDLRHTSATWMAARGVPERTIQEVMGHSSIVTTQIYTKGMAKVANLYKHMLTGLK